ncbi:MAG: tetratricopeptide repeat protein [Candidatus Marinimicrobia bacterium]|nr:tetratricopeptide repeat protein [Candidatus Neomarinimicrobiota bacterium]
MNLFNTYISRDIRDLFPSKDVLLPPDVIIKHVYEEQLNVKTEDIYKLNLISRDRALYDLSKNINSDDDIISGISWTALGGIHTFNGNYREAFSAFNVAFEKSLSKDGITYLYIELSCLLRRLKYENEARSILENILNDTKNINLRHRAITELGTSYEFSNPDKALFYLYKAEKYFRSIKDNERLVPIIRHIGSTYINQKKYNEAQDCFDEAVAISLDNNLLRHYYSCLNDIGWLHVAKGDYEWAKQIYLDLLTYNLSPYSKSLALQNLGYIAYEKKDFKEAISYHSQSLRITRDQDMRDMLFEDYYKLGKSYEHIGETDLADHFYSEGYRELQKEINLGLRLMGYRKSLLDNYVIFLQANQQNPNVKLNDKIFDFTKDKQFKEIRKFFQRSLLVKHLERMPDTNSLCSQLGFDQRTYFNYQKKLDLKRGDVALDVDNPYFDQYLESLAQYPWREANNRFESELYSHLLSRYQFNKKKLAKALGVSYAQVVQKTSKVRIES